MESSHLAEIPREARQTQALEAVHLVLTAAAIQARRADALVHVPLAVLAGESEQTHAAVTIYQVLKRDELKGLNCVQFVLVSSIYNGVAKTLKYYLMFYPLVPNTILQEHDQSSPFTSCSHVLIYCLGWVESKQ